MSLMGKIQGLGSWLWQHKSAPLGLADSSLTVLTYLADQVAAIPRMIRSIATHPPTRQVAKHVSRVLVQDVTVVVGITYGVTWFLQQNLTNSNTENKDNPQNLDNTMANTALLLAIQVLPRILALRSKLKMLGRTTLINLELSKLSEVQERSGSCEKEGCAPLDLYLGAGTDFAVYFATELGLLVAELMPVPGISLAIIIARVEHNGLYIMSAASATLCYKHKQNYLYENQEVAVSLGLGHFVSSWLATSLMQKTGIPSSYYASIIDLLTLIAHVSVANHMTLPPPKKSTGRIPPPVALCQAATAWGIEIFAAGLEKRLPSMLEEQLEPNLLVRVIKKVPASKIGDAIVWTLQDSMIAYLIPTLLKNRKGFTNDPIVRDSLTELQRAAEKFLRNLEQAPADWRVKVANVAPSITGEAARISLGLPPAITRLVLRLINTPSVMEKIRSWRMRIETLRLEAVTAIRVNRDDLRLNGHVRLPDPEVSQALRALTITPPDNVIRLRGARPPVASPEEGVEGVIRITRQNFHGPRATTPTPPGSPVSSETIEDDWVELPQQRFN